MTPDSPLLALTATLLALLVMHLFTRRTASTALPGRYATIDGLRGYLGFFVFLHHSCIWYQYLQTGRWELPVSRLYTHLGQSSVALFFMITGFLFFSKLLDHAHQPLDWKRLAISRLLRLTPVYLLATGLLFTIVAILSSQQILSSTAGLGKDVLSWLLFTIPGGPDLNGVSHTFTIVAGVTWSLPYEWFFYLTLPLLAWPARVKVSWQVACISLLLIAGMMTVWHPNGRHLLAFAGGMGAAWAVRKPTLQAYARSRYATAWAFLSLLVCVSAFKTAYQFMPTVLLTSVFVIIAAGNDLLGALSLRSARALGDMAYSIYMLHGLVLFVLFRFVIGLDAARGLGEGTYSVVLLLLTPLLLLIGHLSFRWVEHPAMQFSKTPKRQVAQPAMLKAAEQ